MRRARASSGITAEAIEAYRRHEALEVERDRLRDVIARALKLRRGEKHPLDVSVHSHQSLVYLPWGAEPTGEDELRRSAKSQETRIAVERAAGIYETDARPHLSDMPADRERWRRLIQARITPDIVKAFTRCLAIHDELYETGHVLYRLSGAKPWEDQGETDPFYDALAEAAEAADT